MGTGLASSAWASPYAPGLATGFAAYARQPCGRSYIHVFVIGGDKGTHDKFDAEKALRSTWVMGSGALQLLREVSNASSL